MSSVLTPKNESPRGLIDERTSKQHFELTLYDAPDGLEELLNNVWHVQWNLPAGQTYLQSNLPHPVQHIVIDPLRGSGMYGCVTKKFDYEITGEGQVLGLKLFPGLGRAFLHQLLSEITDSYVPLQRLIGDDLTHELECDLNGNKPIASVVERFGKSISPLARGISQSMREARVAVELIDTSKDIFRVADIACHLGVTARQIQRLFSVYIGMPPKWVIDRYRILEALDEMNSGKHVDISDLALKLGYSDQSHFSNQFKVITGFSPSAYQKKQAFDLSSNPGGR
ncbi:MAG: helix-turn-helix domain-containing protein [Pseudomonadota bacterium]